MPTDVSSVTKRCREDRMRDLEAHFSAEYDQFLRSLDNQLETLEKASKQSELMELPHSQRLPRRTLRGV